MKHTPTPWKIDAENRIIQKNDPYYIVGKMFNSEDAEYIVHCVNNYESLKASHKELVIAARALLERVDLNGGIGEYRGGPAFAVKNLREALEAVEHE